MCDINDGFSAVLIGRVGIVTNNCITEEYLSVLEVLVGGVKY